MGVRGIRTVTTHRPVEVEEEWPGWSIHHSNSQRQGAAGHTDLASLLPCSHWLSSADQEGAPRRPSRAQVGEAENRGMSRMPVTARRSENGENIQDKVSLGAQSSLSQS